MDKHRKRLIKVPIVQAYIHEVPSIVHIKPPHLFSFVPTLSALNRLYIHFALKTSGGEWLTLADWIVTNYKEKSSGSADESKAALQQAKEMAIQCVRNRLCLYYLQSLKELFILGGSIRSSTPTFGVRASLLTWSLNIPRHVLLSTLYIKRCSYEWMEMLVYIHFIYFKKKREKNIGCPQRMSSRRRVYSIVCHLMYWLRKYLPRR